MLQENRERFKDLILQDLSYYERRYEVVCLIIIGFITYSVLEIGKLFLDKGLQLSNLLFSVIVIAALLVILCLINLMVQRSIKEYHLAIIGEEINEGEREKARRKSPRRERLMLFIRKIILLGIIVCFSFLIISLRRLWV